MSSADDSKTPRRRGAVRWAVGGGVLLGVALLALVILSLLEDMMIYFPVKEIRADPSYAGLPFEEVSIETADGVRIHGWWVPAEGAERCILLLHGNAGNISDRIDRIDLFHRLGVNTLIIDYRGYGRSGGRPSEDGLYRDADAAYRHLVDDRAIPPGRIVVFGKSLGGAVAVDLVSREEVGGLILESTFTSIREMARLTVPILPAHLLVRSRFDSIEKVQRCSGPLLVIHGERDEIVPFEMGRRIFEAAGGEKQFLALPRSSHNDVLMTGGEPYRTGLRDFLSGIR